MASFYTWLVSDGGNLGQCFVGRICLLVPQPHTHSRPIRPGEQSKSYEANSHYLELPQNHVPTSDRISYRHGTAHDIDHWVPSSQYRLHAVPRLAEVRSSKIDRQDARPGTAAEPYRRAFGTTDDLDVQQQIFAQNARIARRPRPPSRQADCVLKRVRFQLPRHWESRHFERDLAGQFERLRFKEPRSRSVRCGSCGQQLSCRRCGTVASAVIE